MKIIFLTVVLLICAAISHGQTDSTSTSKIYIIRSTGFTGSARQFKIFMNGNLTCKISNDCYTIQDVMPGKYYFAVQLDGQELKENTEKIEIVAEPNTNYYIAVVIETNSLWSKTYFNELTEKSAKSKLSKLKQTNCK